ncbi:MAG: DUF3592 domain-containing protein [Armatimonadota bacterium]
MDDQQKVNNLPVTHYPPPPRAVPWHVSLGILFGDKIAESCWIFFFVGMIFFWIFTAFTDFSIPVFWGGVDVFQGEISEAEATGTRYNRGNVCKFTYTYVDTQGTKQTGISYSEWQRYESGDICTIEVARWNRQLSRIEETRRAPVGLDSLVAGIFPLIGFLGILTTFITGVKGVWMLRNGCITYARYTHRVRISGRIPRLFFKFVTNEAQEIEAYQDTRLQRRLMNDEFEMLLYNPRNPKSVVLLDSLPVNVKVIEDGSVVSRYKKSTALGLLLWPIFMITANGLYIYCKFFGLWSDFWWR